MQSIGKGPWFLSQRDDKTRIGGKEGPFEDAAGFAFLFISLKGAAQVFKLCEYMEILAGCDASRNSGLRPGLNVSGGMRVSLSPSEPSAIVDAFPLLNLLFRRRESGKGHLGLSHPLMDL